jgi:hypothetical protein
LHSISIEEDFKMGRLHLSQGEMIKKQPVIKTINIKNDSMRITDVSIIIFGQELILHEFVLPELTPKILIAPKGTKFIWVEITQKRIGRPPLICMLIKRIVKGSNKVTVLEIINKGYCSY